MCSKEKHHETIGIMLEFASNTDWEIYNWSRYGQMFTPNLNGKITFKLFTVIPLQVNPTSLLFNLVGTRSES